MGFDMQAIVWLVLLVVLLAIEAVTLGLTTIWFAGGALVAFVLALAGAGLFIQVAVFCVISVILLIFTRPVAAGWLNHGRVRTNAQSLIGETAVVTEEIDNLANSGQVQVRGQYWMARTEQENTRILKKYPCENSEYQRSQADCKGGNLVWVVMAVFHFMWGRSFWSSSSFDFAGTGILCEDRSSGAGVYRGAAWRISGNLGCRHAF